MNTFSSQHSQVFSQNVSELWSAISIEKGAVVFGIGGASDAIWHTLFGIETGVEPLITPSHLMLFLGSFLMLDYVFTARPSKEKLDNAAIFSAATSYGLVMFITLFINPFLDIWSFIDREDELAAGNIPNHGQRQSETKLLEIGSRCSKRNRRSVKFSKRKSRANLRRVRRTHLL